MFVIVWGLHIFQIRSTVIIDSGSEMGAVFPIGSLAHVGVSALVNLGHHIVRFVS
jgi:hypothetical protein